MNYNHTMIFSCALAAVIVATLTIQAVPVDTTVKNTEILREVNKLMALADADNLSLADTVALGALISEKTSAEYAELVWMTGHGYQHHALHSLQGIYWKEIGKEFPCPAEAFAHASAYLQFNDADRARHAVEVGAKKLALWEPIARADKAKDPEIYPGLDNIISVMKQEIAAMKEGNLVDVKLAADFLDDNGYC